MANRIAAVLVVALVVGGCSPAPSEVARVTADTTCRDYLEFDSEERARAVRSLGADLGWRDASNPILGLPSVDAACGSFSDPAAITVGQLIAGWADETVDSGNDGSETPATESPTTSQGSNSTATADPEPTDEAHWMFFGHSDGVFAPSCQGLSPNLGTMFETGIIYTCGRSVGFYNFRNQQPSWEFVVPGDDANVTVETNRDMSLFVLQTSQLTEASGLVAPSVKLVNYVLDTDGALLWSIDIDQYESASIGSDLTGKDLVVSAPLAELGSPIILMETTGGVSAFDPAAGPEPLWTYTAGADWWDIEGVSTSTAIINDKFVVDLVTGQDLWTIEDTTQLVFSNRYSPVVSTGWMQIQDDRTGETIFETDFPYPGLSMTPYGVFNYQRGGPLEMVSFAGEPMWTISASVIQRTALYGDSGYDYLIVETTAGEYLGVDLATGTETHRIAPQIGIEPEGLVQGYSLDFPFGYSELWGLWTSTGRNQEATGRAAAIPFFPDRDASSTDVGADASSSSGSPSSETTMYQTYERTIVGLGFEPVEETYFDGDLTCQGEVVHDYPSLVEHNAWRRSADTTNLSGYFYGDETPAIVSYKALVDWYDQCSKPSENIVFERERRDHPLANGVVWSTDTYVDGELFDTNFHAVVRDGSAVLTLSAAELNDLLDLLQSLQLNG